MVVVVVTTQHYVRCLKKPAKQYIFHLVFCSTFVVAVRNVSFSLIIFSGILTPFSASGLCGISLRHIRISGGVFVHLLDFEFRYALKIFSRFLYRSFLMRRHCRTIRGKKSLFSLRYLLYKVNRSKIEQQIKAFYIRS